MAQEDTTDEFLVELKSIQDCILTIPVWADRPTMLKTMRIFKRAANLPPSYDIDIVKTLCDHFQQHPADGSSYKEQIRSIRKANLKAENQSKKAAKAEAGILNSDLANSNRFVKYFGRDMRYTDELGWLHWNGGLWENGSHDAIELAKETSSMILEEAKLATGDKKETLLDWAKSSQDASRLRAIVFLSSSHNSIRAEMKDFDADPWLLNCQNGLLNLKKGLLQPHERTALCTRISPATYGVDSSEAPLWLEFLKKITQGDAQLEKYLQRAAGYCLTGSVAEKCFFFCYGSGDNGKTVFIEVLHALLGDYSLALSTETLIKKKYGNQGIPNDVARLCGPRLATVSETGKGEEWNDALIKDLTGGDIITARFLRKEFFDFKPQCKLMIRGNNKPDVSDSSAGMWKRIQLIPFEAQIPESEQDKELRNKIVNRELSGVLMWALEGCLDWQREGLAIPDKVKQASQEYRNDMDIVGQFLDCCTIPMADMSISASDMYAVFEIWAEENGRGHMGKNKFGMELSQRNLKRLRDSKKRVYDGLFFTEEYCNKLAAVNSPRRSMEDMYE